VKREDGRTKTEDRRRKTGDQRFRLQNPIFVPMKYMQALLIFINLLPICNSVLAQNKPGGKFLSSKKDTTRSSSFMPLPAIAYAQETGLEFGVVSLYSFYTDRRDIETRNSSITGIATFTTKKQSNFKLLTDIWSPQNKFQYLSEIRYKNFPFNFYGVGNKTLQANEDKLDQKLFKISAEIEKLFSSRFYAGINTSFENYHYTDKLPGGIFSSPDPFILDRDGGTVLYVGLNQVSDSRNTNTYTTKGSYLKLSYAYAPDLFGGENFTGGLFKADFRHFKSFDVKTVFAIQVIYQSLMGSKAPFYLLPQLGNDQMMRGYYTGRYRDKNLLAAQAELRYRFTPKLGAVGFLGAGNVYHNGLKLEDFKPTHGAGLRYFFDVDRGLSIRLDYGVGEKRANEKRQEGFYVSLAEAF